MSISKRIKALLSICGKKQSDLAAPLNMNSKQSLSNKFTNERWSAADLVEIADYCGCEIAFIAPDGTKISLTKED